MCLGYYSTWGTLSTQYVLPESGQPESPVPRLRGSSATRPLEGFDEHTNGKETRPWKRKRNPALVWTPHFAQTRERGLPPSLPDSPPARDGLNPGAQALWSCPHGGAAPRSPARPCVPYWSVFARNLLSGSDGASWKVGRPLALFACWVSIIRPDNICPFIGLGSKRFAEVHRPNRSSSF